MPSGAIITTLGLAKLASATPLNQLNISALAVGDGNGGYPALTPSTTALTNEVWRGTPSPPIRDPNSPNVLIFEAVIPPSVGGFTVREQAIFDDAGDMIAIGQTSVVEKPLPNDATGVILTVRLHIQLDSAGQVDLFFQDDPTISAGNISNANGGSVQDFIDAQYSTVAELATGKFQVGQYVRLADRAMGLFLLESGGTPDSNGVFDAGNGNTAVLQTYDNPLRADQFGFSKSKTATQNGDLINSLITLTDSDCIILPFNAPLEGVIVNRKIKIKAETSGQFEVQTDGAFCIKLIKGSVASIIDGVSPILMGINQTKIIIDGREGVGSEPQLNKFYNINTEAGESGTKCRDGSLSLLLTNTWSNFFYGVTFNRSQNGIQFGVEGEDENQTNANYFIGCELRSVNTYTNGGQAIIHYGGDANTWLGGIIENWKLNSDIHAGGFVVTAGAYLEAFADASTFTLRGGSLKITECFMNSPFVFVTGESSLVYENNTVRTDLSNINYPIIQMRADVLCKMSVNGNKPKSGESTGYFTRNGKWRNSAGTWFSLTSGLKNQLIDDNNTFIFSELTFDIPNITGDGTEYAIAPTGSDVLLDEVGEYSLGSTIPRSGGIYEVSGVVTLTGITFTGVLSMYVRSNSGAVINALATETISPSDSVSGVKAFNFSGIVAAEAGQSIQVRISVSGGTKTVGIKGKSGGSLAVRNTYFMICQKR